MSVNTREVPWWFYALIPLSVYGLAEWFFSLGVTGAPDPAQLISDTVEAQRDVLSASLLEIPARLSWLSLAFLYIVVQIAVIVWCFWRLWKTYQSGWTVPLIFAIVLTVLLTGKMFFSFYLGSSAFGRGVYGYTMDVLERLPIYEESFKTMVKAVMFFINVASIVGMVAILTVAMSLLGKTGKQCKFSLDVCLMRIHRLHQVMILGTLFLVTGVLHMGAWLRWPSSLVDDQALQTAFHAVAASVSGYWGLVFSIVAVFLFLLPAQILKDALQHRIKNDPEISDTKLWLETNGIELEPLQHFQRIFLIVAPMLAAPLGDFLNL